MKRLKNGFQVDIFCQGKARTEFRPGFRYGICKHLSRRGYQLAVGNSRSGRARAMVRCGHDSDECFL